MCPFCKRQTYLNKSHVNCYVQWAEAHCTPVQEIRDMLAWVPGEFCDYPYTPEDIGILEDLLHQVFIKQRGMLRRMPSTPPVDNTYLVL